MTKVYLSGPITGLTHDEAKYSWRNEVRRELYNLGVEFLCPMRNNESLRAAGPILATTTKPMAPIVSDKGVTMRDRWDCQRMDIMFCNVIGAPVVSKGTVLEIGWADAWRKPIILCMEPGNVHEHGMINCMASIIVPTLEEGIQVLRGML